MKTLYIHIGMPKTGSSAIQAFFACNNEELKKVDYCYPWHPGFGQAFQTSAGNATNIHHWIVEGKIEELEKAIDSLDENNVILSSEVLFHTARLHPEKFIRAFDSYNIKVISYIRKIDDLIDSCVNQLVKNHALKNYTDLETIVDDHDYSSTLLNLSKYIEKEKINIRVYDRSSFPDNDIYQDILDATELSGKISKSDLTPPEKSVNPSLVPEAFKVRQILNEINFGSNVDQFKYAFNGVLAKYSVNKDGKKFSILTEEERSLVFEYFKEREIKLNHIFFGVEKRFFKEITKIQKPEVRDEDVLEVLSFIKEDSPDMFSNIVMKSIDFMKVSYSQTLYEMVDKCLMPLLKYSDRLTFMSLMRRPLLVILPNDFSVLTHSFSEDLKSSQEFNRTRLLCSGNDPYFSFKKIDSKINDGVYIRIVLHSNVECKAQIHYQTINEPFYGNKKFELVRVNSGYNVLEFMIDVDSLNGCFRFDPIMKEGVVDIYSVVFY